LAGLRHELRIRILRWTFFVGTLSSARDSSPGDFTFDSVRSCVADAACNLTYRRETSSSQRP
jgi:hypothetical protein